MQVGTANNWASVSTGWFYIPLPEKPTAPCGLGDGITRDIWALVNTTNQYSPVQVGTANNWASVSTRYFHTLALKTDGTLWAWGDNANGQLGIGNTTNQISPVQVGTANNWASVAIGARHSLALKSDNTLWAWGRNDEGQLGIGNYPDQYSPVQLGTLVTVSQNTTVTPSTSNTSTIYRLQ